MLVSLGRRLPELSRIQVVRNRIVRPTSIVSRILSDSIQVSDSASYASDSPASGHSGINIATQQATDDVIVVDLRQERSTYENILWLQTTYPEGSVGRVPTLSYQSGGGYYGQGCARFFPGYFFGAEEQDPGGEHMCGIGQLLGFNAVAPGGTCTALTVGMLVRYGPDYWLTAGEGEGKQMIVLRAGGPDTRPMIIARGQGANGHVLGPCDGTLGNYSTDPDDDDFFNEQGSGGPDQFDLANTYQWVQFEVDLLEPTGAGQARVLLWDENEVHSGTPILRNSLIEEVGGNLPGTDIINSWCRSRETLTSGLWFETEYIEIWVGQASGMTPPVGFPGSAR